MTEDRLNEPMSHDEALVECDRRDARSKFIEHFPTETRPGEWKLGSRVRPDWRRFSTSDRLDDPVRKGERFVAKTDITVSVNTHWRAPFTGGNASTLPAGIVVIVKHDQQPDAPGFNCVPEDYERLEAVLVSGADRDDAKYGGYSLSFVLDDIGIQLDPVP